MTPKRPHHRPLSSERHACPIACHPLVNRHANPTRTPGTTATLPPIFVALFSVRHRFWFFLFLRGFIVHRSGLAPKLTDPPVRWLQTSFDFFAVLLNVPTMRQKTAAFQRPAAALAKMLTSFEFPKAPARFWNGPGPFKDFPVHLCLVAILLQKGPRVKTRTCQVRSLPELYFVCRFSWQGSPGPWLACGPK